MADADEAIGAPVDTGLAGASSSSTARPAIQLKPSSKKRKAEEPAEDRDAMEEDTGETVDDEGDVKMDLSHFCFRKTNGVQENKDLYLCQIERVVRESFSANEIDVDTREVKQITKLLGDLTAVDVAEVFSPPRFTKRAANFGLKPGFAADLTEWMDEYEKWNFDEARTRSRDEETSNEGRSLFANRESTV